MNGLIYLWGKIVSFFNAVLGTENMGTTATTIKGAIAEHEQDIIGLNNSLPKKSVSGGDYKGTKSGQWEYTNLSFTVPNNHLYLACIQQGWNTGKPLGLGVSTSSSEANPGKVLLGDLVQEAVFYCSPGTWYIYTYRASVPTSTNHYWINLIDITA